MGLGEEVGKTLARSIKRLSSSLGSEFVGSARKAAGEMADYRNDAVKKMNDEVAIHSINVELFKSEEIKKLTTELKEKLAHSPADVSGWFSDSLGGLFEGFYDILIGVVSPDKIDDFSKAKAGAGYLVILCVDVVVLVSLLDVIATACSLTLVRNLAKIGEIFINTLGLNRYIGAVISPALNAGLEERLKQGFNEHYQARIPNPGDLVRFQLREVFDPAYRPELLTPGTGAEYRDAMRKHGYNDYWSDSYWAAHWELPSKTELDEMLHRRIINPATWEDYIKRNDYLPAMIKNRMSIIYDPYTRVDARRMYDLALLTGEELFDNFRDLGYDDAHAQRMTIWTKCYVLSTELRARYSKGWITAPEVKQALIDAGMPENRADQWVQKIVQADQEERVNAERDLTKSEIVKGVKAGKLTVEEGIELLMDMGYDYDEADYIIDINVESLTGSPETFEDFKRITNKRRKALGLEVTERPPAAKKPESAAAEIEETPAES